jgi:hypothetical protein
MKPQRGLDVYINVFLEVSGQLHAPAALSLGKFPRYLLGRRLGPTTGLDDVERRKILRLPGLELRLLGRPARSQSLYRLRAILALIYLLSRV